jgi:hypothetical protein
MILAVCALALLSACAAGPLPTDPQPLECPDPTDPPADRPVDGGLGGTGNTPPAQCKPDAV